MSIILRENQYKGINAHLHSYFQHDTTNAWGEFHHVQLTHLFEALIEQLPARYRVRVERSLQIREYNPTTGERVRRPVPDLTLVDLTPGAKSRGAATASSTAPRTILPATETMLEPDDEDYLRALIIYDKDQGIAITRIELLSPTNKLPGDGGFQYQIKRDAALWSGLALVEIDYLHESKSPIGGIPYYPQHPDSYPYNIVVTNPRPMLQQGEAYIYSFRVDEPIPRVLIPLADEETLDFDFGVVYMRTFRLLSFYEAVDYEQLPVAIESYDGVDRERIEQVCKRVKETYLAS